MLSCTLSLLAATFFFCFAPVLAQAPDVQWTDTFGGSGLERVEDVIQTADGGYLITGLTTSFGSGFEDVYLVKLDAEGNIEWDQVHGSGVDDHCFALTESSDGGFLLAGYRGSGDTFPEFNAYVVRTDATGNFQFENEYDSSINDRIHDVEETAVAVPTVPFEAR